LGFVDSIKQHEIKNSMNIHVLTIAGDPRRRVWRNKGVIRIRISKKNRQHNGKKKKVQKDKQQSTKYTHTIKDRVTWISLKIGGELRCSGRVSSSCSTNGTRCVNLVYASTNLDEFKVYTILQKDHLLLELKEYNTQLRLRPEVK
jgi:hypothetical protein